MSLSAQSRAMRGSTLAAVGFPPAAFHFTPHASFHIVERRHRGAADAHPLDAAHGHRRAVGLVLQFVCLAVPVDRAAGDAGKFQRHEVADLLAEAGSSIRSTAPAGRRPSACPWISAASGRSAIRTDWRSGLRPLSPENVMMWLSSPGSSSATVKFARPSSVWKKATARQRKIPSRDLERAAFAGHHRKDDGVGLRPWKFVRGAGRHCNENDGKGESLPAKLHGHARLIGHGARCDQRLARFRKCTKVG